MARTSSRILLSAAAVLLCCVLAGPTDAAGPQPIGLPGADLKAPVIWGAEASSPDGLTLAFGGSDQKADDGRPHTRLKNGGEWTDLAAELRAANPLQAAHAKAWAARNQLKNAVAALRGAFFEGKPANEQRAANERGAAAVTEITDKLVALADELTALAARSNKAIDDYARGQAQGCADRLKELCRTLTSTAGLAAGVVTAEAIATLSNAQVALEVASEMLDAEPPARALSPLIWHPASKRFYLFGGDHLDYLTNDTWAFDPAAKRWQQLHPKTAPPPRANHKLALSDDGRIELTGGYTYYNDIWYMGGPYLPLQDGTWTFDPAAVTWSSAADAKSDAPDARTYRAKEFNPLTYLQGPAPDAAANEAKLAQLPANQWVVMNPPVKPRMNRDWGSACLDADHDVMLRFSGGHCAHGGSDVILYHFATNRWEMPFPVEFPLGQTYSNTSYPGGFNFNLRPWVSGHTYKCFGYDPASKTMLFLGHNPWCYLFDPAVADWTGRVAKPPIMNYDSSFYTLTVVTAGKGLYCWGGQYGRAVSMCKWQPDKREWRQLKLSGVPLPCPTCDHCGLAYDAKRDRLLLFPKSYGGQLWAMDCKTNVLSAIEPTGDAAAVKPIGFWRELAYVPEADWVVILGATLPAAAEGAELRPTLAYDCGKNQWLALKVSGTNPAGKGGRNVSMGAMYDPARKLLWATDTNSQIYVLRLDATTVDRETL